jgi:hypothetical protein
MRPHVSLRSFEGTDQPLLRRLLGTRRRLEDNGDAFQDGKYLLKQLRDD